jgi:hypothetical protein
MDRFSAPLCSQTQSNDHNRQVHYETCPNTQFRLFDVVEMEQTSDEK